jgi:hypothetical protein
MIFFHWAIIPDQARQWLPQAFPDILTKTKKMVLIILSIIDNGVSMASYESDFLTGIANYWEFMDQST